MRITRNARRVTTVTAALGLLATGIASGAQAAESVNIPAISTASWQQGDRSGANVTTSTRRDDYPGAFPGGSQPPSSVTARSTRMVSVAGATSFSYEVRNGTFMGEGRPFGSLGLLEGRGLKAGAVSTSNPAPGRWLTANLARAAARGTAEARRIPASLSGTTAITGVTGVPLASAAVSFNGTPPIEIARVMLKVPQPYEPADGRATTSSGNFALNGFLTGTTQHSWQKASFTGTNGDQCRDGEFFLQTDAQGLMTAFLGKMICRDKNSKAGAEYRFTFERRVASYNVKDADVPGAPRPSVTAASLGR